MQHTIKDFIIAINRSRISYYLGTAAIMLTILFIIFGIVESFD